MTMHTANAEVSEAFAEMQGLNTEGQMRVEKLAWGELAWGMYLVDTNRKVWQVAGRCNGWIRLLDINGDEVSVPPQPLDKPVDVVVLPQAEAVLLLEHCLGARVEQDNFTQARQLLVAQRWAVEMMPTTGNKGALNKLRDHLNWFHANQWVESGKKIDELAQIHEEMHESIADMPMSKPHHHALHPGAKA